jgi:hydroxyacylglutathione hydrolase
MLVMNVVIVPCLFDNYAYLIVDEVSSRAVVVDPSEGVPLLARMDELGLELAGVLCTHHHGDHVGGLPEILERHPSVRVFAHERDGSRVPGVTDTVRHKDEVEIGGQTFRALHVPGHTLGAVAWVVEDCAFTGDTLFVGGCGRIFEGTARMMHASLNDVLGGLAPSTKVYCGHEYTLSNLRFAQHVEPSNAEVEKELGRVGVLRERREPTVPSTLAQERATNPFLRCSEPAVVDFARESDAGGVDPVSVFAAVRAAKNQFPG